MSLEQLAAFAVANNNAGTGAQRVQDLSIEAARDRIKIKDGNKKPNEDGSVALTLVLGKRVMKLDAIAPGATRVNASAEQLEQFTAVLQENINAGAFDEAIATVQQEYRDAAVTAAEKAAAAAASEGDEETPNAAEESNDTVPATSAPAGVDLDELG